MSEDNVVNVIFSQQQLMDHVLNHVPPIPPMTVAEMLNAERQVIFWGALVPSSSMVLLKRDGDLDKWEMPSGFIGSYSDCLRDSPRVEKGRVHC